MVCLFFVCLFVGWLVGWLGVWLGERVVVYFFLHFGSSKAFCFVLEVFKNE